MVRDEGGFTLYEIMVAVFITVTGLLGAAVMLDQANRTTGETSAREGGTVLTREVLERAREVPYAQLVGSAAANTIRAALPDRAGTAAHGGGFTVPRRNGLTYTVAYSACKVDDPSDGTGVHTADYCDRQAAASAGGSSAPVSASSSSVGLTLVGIPLTVSVGGSLLDALCATVIGTNPVGANPVLDRLLGRGSTSAGLLALAKSGADVRLCANNGGSQFALDEDPDDLTRVTATTSWSTGGASRSVRQAVLIANPT